MAREINLLPKGLKVSIGKHNEGSLIIYNKNLIGVDKVKFFINYPFDKEEELTLDLMSINVGDIIDWITSAYVWINKKHNANLDNIFIEGLSLNVKEKEIITILGLHGERNDRDSERAID